MKRSNWYSKSKLDLNRIDTQEVSMELLDRESIRTTGMDLMTKLIARREAKRKLDEIRWCLWSYADHLLLHRNDLECGCRNSDLEGVLGIQAYGFPVEETNKLAFQCVLHDLRSGKLQL